MCITVDFDSLDKETVTVRDRDSMDQQVIKISELTDLQKILKLKPKYIVLDRDGVINVDLFDYVMDIKDFKFEEGS